MLLLFCKLSTNNCGQDHTNSLSNDIKTVYIISFDKEFVWLWLQLLVESLQNNNNINWIWNFSSKGYTVLMPECYIVLMPIPETD